MKMSQHQPTVPCCVDMNSGLRWQTLAFNCFSPDCEKRPILKQFAFSSLFPPLLCASMVGSIHPSHCIDSQLALCLLVARICRGRQHMNMIFHKGIFAFVAVGSHRLVIGSNGGSIQCLVIPIMVGVWKCILVVSFIWRNWRIVRVGKATIFFVAVRARKDVVSRSLATNVTAAFLSSSNMVIADRSRS